MLNKHAPLKKKVLRVIQVPYVTKALRNTIMKNSYLEKLGHRTYLEKLYFKKDNRICEKV